MVKDRFPIPTIEDMIDELGGSKYFTKLDLGVGYHQIHVADEDVHKTAFRTHIGHTSISLCPSGYVTPHHLFKVR